MSVLHPAETTGLAGTPGPVDLSPRERQIPFARIVPEPFRDDPRFWRSVFASADAVLALGAAALVAVPLMFVLGSWLALAPFVVPAAFLLVAGVNGAISSRHSKAFYVGQGAARQSWRVAERRAVTRAFGPAMRRNRRTLP